MALITYCLSKWASYLAIKAMQQNWLVGNLQSNISIFIPLNVPLAASLSLF